MAIFSEFTFGDMVTTYDGGCYMVIAPYTGKRGSADPEGPAVWLMDIDTEYSRANEAATTWCVAEELRMIDE